MITQQDSDLRAGLVLSTLFLFLCVATWNTYGNLLMDNFHDIWFSQRVLAGDVPYRDFHYQYGVLPPYLLAGLLALGGVHFTTFIIIGLVIAVLSALFVYRICRLFSGSFAAFVAVLIFFMHSVFARSEPESMFNFVRPYSLASTSFCLWVLALLFFLLRFTLEGQKRDYGFIHLFMVLAFLSRPIMFLPIWAMVLCFLFFASGRRGQFSFFSLNLSWIAAVLLHCVFLLPTQSMEGFLNNTFFFAYLSKVNPYSSGLMGLDAWPTHLEQAGLMTLLHLVVLALLIMLIRFSADRTRPWQLSALGCFVAIVTLSLWLLWQEVDPVTGKWLYQYRAMLATNVCATLFFGFRLFKGPTLRERALFGLALFALVSSLRMLLVPIPYVYGFFILVPSFILYVLVLFELIPGTIFKDSFLPGRRPYALMLLFCLLGLSFGQIQLYRYFQAQRTFSLSTSLGTILLPEDQKNKILVQALAGVRERIGENETLVAFPEGVYLNSLTGRASVWGFPHFFPSDFDLFGEDLFIAELEASPPDYIALVHRHTPEYGPSTFGQNYALRLASWLRSHYRPVEVFGAMPFQSDAFGIMLAERKKPGTGAP